jgi:hypothetical protein
MAWQRGLWLVAAVWWGSLTALGAWVVPLLFAHASSKAVAAGLAVHLFSAQAWVGLVCGLLSLLVQRHIDRVRGRPQVPSVLILAAMLMAAIVEWGIAPRIVARENMLLWHSLGTAFWVLQWGCLTAHVWRLSRTALDAPWPMPDSDEKPKA